nr:CehA/McbA family metallohydrolase [Acidicapsa ligni]
MSCIAFSQKTTGAALHSGSASDHTLSIQRQGEGRGNVESLDSKLACDSSCTVAFPASETVRLIAVPARDSTFLGWQGACRGTGTCAVSMKQARTVVARFSQVGPMIPAGTWLAGDLHVHDDHSYDGSLARQRNHDKAKGNVSVADQIAQGTANGLKFMPLTDHRTYDQHYDPLWESSSLLLLPGEEANTKPHATVLGAVDSIIQGASRADRADFTHVQQSVWDAHSQDAVWSVAHPDDGEMNTDGSLNALANVQGVDLIEIWNRARNVEKQIDYDENRWNAGFRFGVAGVSDSHMRELWKVAGPGMNTSSVFAEEYNERAILAGLRAGHTSLSPQPTGPFLTFTTDLKGGGYTAMGGDEIIVPAGTRGHLRIRVQRAAGLQVLVYRKPGRSAGPLKTFVPASDDETVMLDVTAGDQPDWYRVEVRGPGLTRTGATIPNDLRAAVSPLFISPSRVEAKPEIAVPEDQGQDDGAVRVAGALGAFAGFPDVAVNAGIIHIVAEVHGVTTSTIVYRRRDARGFWSDAGQTLSGKGMAQFPRVVARGNDVWVTWQEDATQIPHRPTIQLRHSVDGGHTWKPTQTVRALEGRAERPALALSANGQPLLVWQEIRATQPFDIMFQEIGADAEPRNLSREGKSISAGTPDDTRSPRYPASVWPAIAVATNGHVAVTWQDNRTDPDPLWTGTAAAGKGTDPDNWQIMVAVRNPSNTWAAPVSLGAEDMADRHPDVAFSGAGDLIVTWESKALEPSGKNLSVRAAVSTDDGLTFAPPTVLAEDAQTMSQHARLGLNLDGSVRAVWFDSRSVDWRWRVMTAVYHKDTGWSTGSLLNGGGNNTWPATAGGAIVFGSTRNAVRLQRDITQQIYLIAVQ